MFKDPVIRFNGFVWKAWICCHIQDENDEWDGMATAYATRRNGKAWNWPDHVLMGRQGTWDARGARVTSVLPHGRVAYDGRRNASENWFEKIGLAVPQADSSALQSISDVPVSIARYL
ncbi:MAG: hypothetical protein WKF81_13140 [Thermomicrobiales bacterium]